MTNINLKLDKNTVSDLETRLVPKILVFFYEAGCSGTKLDISENFEVSDDLVKLDLEYSFEVYLEKKDAEKFDGAIVTKLKVDKNDDNPHLKGVKEKYIFSNPKVLDRCGCGTSFSFEAKKIEIDLEKLKKLKKQFGK